MSLRTTYSAETWERIYQSFAQVSFVSYDFDSIRQSLVDYTRIYYPEVFNDYVTSSEFIALIESFAYIAEQLAYRIDMVSHENFITTAQRKQSILRLAKLISYKATRNIPVRGMVKFNTVSTTERTIDSRGVDISGLTITWNDPNNPNWKEQFILVMNKILSSRFGQPQKTFQVGDVVMDLYNLRNTPESFTNGVYPFTVSTGLDSFEMEVVPADLDTNGPFEREPDTLSSMSIIYANDGIGDGSDYTGFLAFIKQGTLIRIDYDLTDKLPNRKLDFSPTNVNHTDVWVQKIADTGEVIERWKEIDTISEQNLVFNDDRSTRKKYEVDTKENDQIEIVFGDGDFSDSPQGLFRFWMRQSANRSLVVQKNKVANQPFGFNYVSNQGITESCSISFNLTTTLQNGSATETIEHIRRSAPATYYAQNRMVNGQDYNTFLLKDPSIIRLKTINRTFAGQPKYIDWNDASGKYENVKIFGDDAVIRYELGVNSQTTSVSGQSLIDSVLEPLLSSSGVINTMLHISATDPKTYGIVSAPRRKFIEDNRGQIYVSNENNLISGDGSLKEKTAIQGLIDRHWYGEPLEYIQDANGTVMAVIPDPDVNVKDDSKIYAANVPRTIDGVNRFPPGDIGSGLQPIAGQEYFGLRYNRYMRGLGVGSIEVMARPDGTILSEVWTIEVLADGKSLAVRSNMRGSFANATIDEEYQIKTPGFQTPTTFFKVTQTANERPLEAGDAFILDSNISGVPTPRVFSEFPDGVINLNGWWEVISQNEMTEYSEGLTESGQQQYKFAPASTGPLKQHSWVIFVKKIHQQPTNIIIGYEVHSRDMKLTIESAETKFWYNDTTQILDSETKKRVFDNIKILRSNLDSTGRVLSKSQVYDVVGTVKNSDGVADVHKLEILPTDLMQEDTSGDLVPDRLLQFETFANGSYEYYELSNPTVTFSFSELPSTINFETGSFIDFTSQYGRRLAMPRIDREGDEGLDFMWQHFSPHTNIIDPSVTNIHDAYLMTRGYYDNVINFIRGISGIAPTAPTPLELRNSYGYLLDKKMLSDTVVLHPGRIKLLFGPLAEPQLRAKFKIVPSETGTLTNEKIKEEVLNVINTYFDIDNWDFGDTFYATKLISLIHQRLPSDIASVVLVPVYSTNSFGSLFTVESGVDEILQSAAQLSDIEVVEALTPTIIRQSR